MTQAAAKDALYDAIAKTARDALEYGSTTQSAMIRDAAIAYRAVYGGQQPGSVVDESK